MCRFSTSSSDTGSYAADVAAHRAGTSSDDSQMSAASIIGPVPSATARSIDVAQLADVARPVVALQLLQRRRREALIFRPVSRTNRFRKWSASSGTSSTRSRSGGTSHLHHLEAEEQVAAERPGPDRLLQRPVGRRHHAHVHLDRRVAADPLERVALQHAQELRLRGRGHLADLVEEDRAAVGRLELADHLLGRPGERPLLVAEQLALQQRLGQRRAVEA